MDLDSEQIQIRKCPKARRNFGITCSESHIYMVGGISLENEFLNNIEVYSIQNDDWKELGF